MSMADTHTYSNPRKGSTRRAASSHIPVPINRHKVKELQHRHSAPEPSRLLMMRNQYQQQLLHEKEAKLIQMYQDNQDAALGRVTGSGAANKRGIVRDFFRERHEIEQSNSASSLDRTEHFQWKKRQNQGELDRMEKEKETQLHRLKRASSERILSQHQRTGLSRSNPLAPLKKGQSQSMNSLQQQQSQDMLYNEPSAQRFGYNRKHVQFSEPTSNQTETQNKAVPHKVKRSSKAQIKPKSEPATSDLRGESEIPVRSKSKKIIEQPDKLRHQVKPRSEPLPRIVDSDYQDNTGYDVSQERKPHSQSKKKSGNIPKPKWKPPATYSDEDEDDQSPPPYFPKAAQVKRKQDQSPNTKRQSRSTKQTSDFQKWQLEQDLERANRLERYNKESESKRELEPDYLFDRDMKEQKAIQRQRKKELDEAEQHQRYMTDLEEQIARKQLELSKLDQESNAELSLSPRQSKPKTKSKTKSNQSAQYSKQEPFSPNQMEFGLSNESPRYNETSSVASSEAIVSKPVKVQRSKRKSNINHNKPKENSTSVSIQDDDEMPELSTASYYAEFADTSEDAVVDLDLEGCPICGRQFARDRLRKHAKVCQKTAKKKPRKVFDARKHRLEGTELAGYVEHGQHKEDERPLH
ncbi:zinc finger C2HC domain-containing protein 1C-like isoform X2 [Patiria miniata]|uniref:C2HC/C3H-type domain-containing protein n=1 Tax=Patiria miniata TaxID=46514 RepID=A0A914BGR1_PATMI|nr:zinc finger C2HC domain-containing protein 1C-like isoform X2 [Patiria miniata]